MSEILPQFKIGDVVRIKDGISDPTEPYTDWSGWHARVADLSYLAQKQPVLLIELDSITLRALSAEYIEQCEEQGMSWYQLNVYPEDVTPAAPRDTPADVDDMQDELGALHGWASLGEQGKRIQAVLGESALDDDLEQMKVWADYLERHLSFPFASEIFEHQGRGPLRVGDQLAVMSIEDVDDYSYGVIARCRRARKQYHFPLADLKALDQKSPNYQLVDDFGVWFSNR
jgi:hypothetical protein